MLSLGELGEKEGVVVDAVMQTNFPWPFLEYNQLDPCTNVFPQPFLLVIRGRREKSKSVKE